MPYFWKKVYRPRPAQSAPRCYGRDDFQHDGTYAHRRGFKFGRPAWRCHVCHNWLIR